MQILQEALQLVQNAKGDNSEETIDPLYSIAKAHFKIGDIPLTFKRAKDSFSNCVRYRGDMAERVGDCYLLFHKAYLSQDNLQKAAKYIDLNLKVI